MSYLTGQIVRTALPKPLASLSCRAFAALFRLDMTQAAAPLSSYATIEDLFTRSLKPGLRPLDGPVCSPADGYLAHSGPVTTGQAIQAKGLLYQIDELVYGDQKGPTAKGRYSWSQTVYLAPHNYHRVHAPFSGLVTRIAHIPGDLWPVNQTFVRRVPRLFARNERLVFTFELPHGGKAHVVMVGAFNVGRMVTPLAPDLTTNEPKQRRRPTAAVRDFAAGQEVAMGQEIGTFMLGSTVVIVFEQNAFPGIKLLTASDNRPILMGQTLCARPE